MIGASMRVAAGLINWDVVFTQMRESNAGRTGRMKRLLFPIAIAAGLGLGIWSSFAMFC